MMPPRSYHRRIRTLAAACFAFAELSHAEDGPLLAVVEGDASVLRGTLSYRAPAGVRLNVGDILETGPNGRAQMEFGDRELAQLGPATRVQLAAAPAPATRASIQLNVLAGWMKLQFGELRPHQPAVAGARSVVATTPDTLVALEGGSGVLHIAPGKTEYFAETGPASLAAIDATGSHGKSRTVPAEQLALNSPPAPVQTLLRPTREFLAAMPLPFRDPLVASGSRTAAMALGQPHPVAFAEVELWLTAPPALRGGFVARFRGRLADPAFRNDVERNIARLPDWATLLADMKRSARAHRRPPRAPSIEPAVNR